MNITVRLPEELGDRMIKSHAYEYDMTGFRPGVEIFEGHVAAGCTYSIFQPHGDQPFVWSAEDATELHPAPKNWIIG